MWEEVLSNNKNAFVLIVLPLAVVLFVMYCLKMLGVKMFGGSEKEAKVTKRINENKKVTKRRSD